MNIARFLILSITCLTVFFLLPVLSGQAQQHEQGNLVCILDASGSMWGQIDGKAKIEIAKETLANLIQGLPDSLLVGLVAYGHRTKGDCEDVEVLSTLGTLDKQALIDQVQSLTPKGKTPLTESVRRTAASLREAEGKTTILLVSDGKETCNGDPCALVRELKESGIDFVLDVIGFDVKADEREQLECMANAGGGVYYNAEDASQFQSALSATADKRELAAGKIHLTTTRNGKEIKAFVAIFDPESGERVDYDWSYLNLGFTRLLSPGEYVLEVTDDKAADAPKQRLTLQIEGGETLEKTVDFSSGVINLATVIDGAPFEAYIEVFREGESSPLVRTFSDNSKHVAKLVLPTGNYDIAVKSSKTKDEPTITLKSVPVEAGQEEAQTVAFESGTLEVSALLQGDEAKAQVTIQEFATGSLIWFEKCKPGKPATFKLSPGKYALSIGDIQAEQKMENVEVPEVVVTAGEVTRLDVELSREP